MRRLAPLFVCPCWIAATVPVLFAQASPTPPPSFFSRHVSFGIKIGAPISDPSRPYSPYWSYSQSRWAGLPYAEFRLPRNFAFEFNAIHRSSQENGSFPLRLGETANPYSVVSGQKVNAWDFPVLLKYRFPLIGGRVGGSRGFRPFLSAGPQLTRESRADSSFYTCLGPQGSCLPPEYPQELTGAFYRYSVVRAGLAGAAGLEFRAGRGGRFTISPEIRFSRPNDGYPRGNRVTALVGFSWGGKE